MIGVKRWRPGLWRRERRWGSLTGMLASVLGAVACEPSPPPLIGPALIEDDALAPLTTTPGNAERGARIFAERGRGHCVLCHQLATVESPFQGDVGPALTGLADRLSPAQIRLRVAAPSAVWPDTIMPAYYRVTDLHQVAPDFAGRPILSAQEIEDVVAFLSQQHAHQGGGAP